MCNRHQIGFWRQRVARMSPVGVREDSQLSGFNQLLNTGLYVGKIAGRRSSVVGDGLSEGRSGFWIRLQRGDDIHPVKRMQVIKMHDMVVNKLRHDHQIANQLGVRRYFVVQRILNRAHRRNAVNQGADTADALRKRPGIARIAAFENNFDAAHHGTGAGGPGDHRPIKLRFDPKVSLDPCDRIDDNRLRAHGVLPASSRLLATNSSKLWGLLSQLKWAWASSKVRRQSEQLVSSVFAPVASISRSFTSIVR